MTQYKVEFLPRDLAIQSGSRDAGYSAAVETIESILNRNSETGLELSHVAEISVTERPGCLLALLGKKGEYVQYNILVFKK